MLTHIYDLKTRMLHIYSYIYIRIFIYIRPTINMQGICVLLGFLGFAGMVGTHVLQILHVRNARQLYHKGHICGAQPQDLHPTPTYYSEEPSMSSEVVHPKAPLAHSPDHQNAASTASEGPIQ